MPDRQINYTRVDGQAWKTVVDTQNSQRLRYFIISWAGWHPTSLLTLHKMSYKYGLDIDEDATDTEKRVEKFMQGLWARPKNGGFANYWWDAECWEHCEGIDMVNLATTYLHAETTFAVLDVRDSLCLQDYLAVGEAARTFNQGPTANRTAEDLLREFVAVLSTSAQYDYRPKKKHSLWTRGWLAQEQLYSKDLVYVHQINVADPKIETRMHECDDSQAAIEAAIPRLRQLNISLTNLAVLERYANLGKTITLRFTQDANPWTLYSRAAAVLPKEARDSRTLLNVLRNIYLNLPPQPLNQGNAENSALMLSIQPMVKSVLSNGYTPIPRLWKPQLGDPLAQKCPSWCFNPVLEMEEDDHYQFVTTDNLFGLGKLRAGVIVEFPEGTKYMKVKGPSSLVTLPADLLRTWPQQGLTLDDLQANTPRPEFVKKGIVLANFVTGNETDFAAIAISDTFCWLTKPDYTEVKGYVDIAFLREKVPGLGEPGSWALRESWII